MLLFSLDLEGIYLKYTHTKTTGEKETRVTCSYLSCISYFRSVDGRNDIDSSSCRVYFLAQQVGEIRHSVLKLVRHIFNCIEIGHRQMIAEIIFS